MDNYRWLTYWRKTKETLFGENSREFFVFLFFLFVSTGFWMLQALDETTETKITIPLKLCDTPEDIKFISELPSELTVTVRDKGTSLLQLWHHSPDTLRLSFTDYDNGNAYSQVHIPLSDISHHISELLPSTAKVLSISPDTLGFYYNHGFHKSIPVVINGKAETDTEHYLLDLTPAPTQITAYASAAMLDTLKMVQTLPFSISELSQDTSLLVRLRPMRGILFEPSYVRINADVDVYMENMVEVPIHSSNFPAGKRLRTFPSHVNVTYKVGYSKSKEVKAEDFMFVVTYEELLQLQNDNIGHIRLKLKSVPQSVSNIRISPETVDYILESNESEEEE